MIFKYSLQKLLDLKDNDKQIKEVAYSDAQKRFEEKATKLYHLLKRKEEIEEGYIKNMELGISIQQVQEQHNALTRMKIEIENQIKETDIARDAMYQSQDELIRITMEIKKFEKVKELKKDAFLLEKKRLEAKQMDEISLQLYANR